MGDASVVVTNDAFGQAQSLVRDFGNGVQENITQVFTANGVLDSFVSQAGFGTPDTAVIFAHDQLDRVTSVTRLELGQPALQEAVYFYEGASSQVHRYFDSRNLETTYERWPGGSIKSATVTSSLPSQPPMLWSRAFTYDGIGRMTTGRAFTTATGAITSDETLSFGWDSLANKVTESSTRGSAVTDTFDGAGQRVSSSLAGWGVSRNFDQIGA